MSALNWLFLCRFWTFRACWKAYFTSLTPSTTTLGLGTPPANSRRTKQFLIPPHVSSSFKVTTAAAWRRVSHSPIRCLRSHISMTSSRPSTSKKCGERHLTFKKCNLLLLLDLFRNIFFFSSYNVCEYWPCEWPWYKDTPEKKDETQNAGSLWTRSAFFVGPFPFGVLWS
jgi:hypothetical protein